MKQPARTSSLRIVVLDDDPTGSQTVHGNLLLLRWDQEQLREALTDQAPFFYVLTNTRAMASQDARSTIREVVAAIVRANQPLGHRLLFISRSDSTLRGHFPVEIDEIRSCLGCPEAIDAVFVVPAFFEGGRFTRNGTHYLIEGGAAKPCHQTEFARDSVFPYASSYLPQWIEDKTAGRVHASGVKLLGRKLLHHPDQLRDFIASLHGNAHVAVDAEDYSDLDAFSEAVLAAIENGGRFLFQSAASLVRALAAVSPKELLTSADIGAQCGPGLVVAGSHVGKTSRQLEKLLQLPQAWAIEVDVEQVIMGQEQRDELLNTVRRQMMECARGGRTPVMMTSRRELAFADHTMRQQAGQTIADFLARIVANLPFRPTFIVLKGGITSHVVLAKGLNVGSVRVLGQILPGVSVIRLGNEHPMRPVPIAIFPGNVGDDAALSDVVERMDQHEDH